MNSIAGVCSVVLLKAQGVAATGMNYFVILVIAVATWHNLPGTLIIGAELTNRSSSSLAMSTTVQCQTLMSFRVTPTLCPIFSAYVHVMYCKEWRGFGRPYFSPYIYITYTCSVFWTICRRIHCFKWCVSLDVGLFNVNNEILGKTRLFVFGEKLSFSILRGCL